MALRLTKDDGEDIGFVKSCFFMGIIDFNELQRWLHHVVETQDDLPDYIWSMLDMKDKFDFKPLKVLGFTPYWDHSREEEQALAGIGYLRSSTFTSDLASKTDAIKLLDDNPHIHERFQHTFPFLTIH
ncbi:hypothetical protein LGQ03_15260 [Loktanella sp. TSTF-M6]|uniref:Uncharacterized protein n=1 Tax=Loktanella gaetbuli TaxID=2881335 RepID=A0ABS8BY33_9RHOB|nr:hypothetical protein [Loktanella gaetbuli]MCB5200599.1 hypothetical protein [Loktanella gaetbuli]